MHASVDSIKYDVTNEVVELFSFCLDFIVFTDAGVSNFSNEELFSEVSSSLVLFFEDLVSWYFLKEEDSITRREFDFRLEIFDYRL